MATELEMLIKQAEELFNEKKYDDIIELLGNSALEKYNNAELYARRARAHDRKNMPDECVMYAQKAIELNPEYWMGYFARGNAWYDKKEYDNAIENYNKAIELNPVDADAYNNRGNAWYDKKEYDKAIENYTKAIELNPVDASAYNGRGSAWSDKKEYDKAIEDYNKAIELNPVDADAYNNRGNTWYEKKEYDKAIENYTKAIELNPVDASAYNGRGSAWSDKKEYDKAIEDYNRAIELNPVDDVAYNNRGIAWYYKKEYDKAIEDYNRAIELNPGNARAYTNKGIIWSDKKEYDKAIENYNKAIELNPEYANAYNGRGVAWFNKKEYDKAIEEYNRIIELNHESFFAYNNRGNAWSAKKEYDKAIENYNKAIELNPGYDVAYNGRGNAWSAKKEYDKAIEDYNKALELNPEYDNAYYNLALSEKDSGNIKAAISHFQRSKELGNRIEDAEYWINDLREREQLAVPLEDEIDKGLQKIKNIVSAIRYKSLVELDVKQVVHYSKLFVADIITNNRQSKLHYSNVIYMNDPLEGKTFIEYLDDNELKNWFERASYKNESTIFLGSFLPVNTKNKDDNAEDMLLMWRTYGKDEEGKDAAGCNFVIDREFFATNETRSGRSLPQSFEEIKAAIEKGDEFTDGNRNSLLKIQYVRGNKILDDEHDVVKNLIDYLKAEIKKLIDKNDKETTDQKAKDFTDSRIFDALQELCHLFKAADYSFEKEVRIIRAELRNSRNIEYYKGPDGSEPKPPKRFYVRSSKPVLPYIRKIFLGPKVANTSHWSLHFDYSIRKEERELIELEDLQKKDSTKISKEEKERLDSLTETYRGILNGSEEKINASQVEIIPSSCHFI